MSKKILTLVTLVVLLASATACERPSITEQAVPDGWLLRTLGWVAPTPAVGGWGWMREALAARIVNILVGLLILVTAFTILFAAYLWLTERGVAEKPER